MFKGFKQKVKRLFSSERMKTLALMLLVGTTAALAQKTQPVTTRQVLPH